MTDTVEVPSSGLTSRRREATRQKLLDAAALVFAEEGLDAASVEAICERAGFTRGQRKPARAHASRGPGK